MKKLLSLLIVLTISGTAVPTTIAASPYQRQEHSSNNNLRRLNDINNTNYIINDSKDNIYFGTSDGAYKLLVGSDTPTKIEGINGYVKSITIDSKDNIYFGSDKGAFVLKQGETTADFVKGYYATTNTSFPKNDLEYLNQLTNITNNVNNILINKKDNDSVFIATNNGIYATLKPYSFSIKPLVNANNPNFNGPFYFLSSDNKNNIYFSSFNKVYYLNIPEAKYQEIYGVNKNINCIINNKYNLYIATDNGLYILKSGETTANKVDYINDNVNLISIDNNNNIYIATDNGLYILKSNEATFEKINSINEKINNILIDKNNNIYFNSNNNVYLLSFLDSNISSILIKKIDINFDISIKNLFIINDNIYITNHDGTIYILYLKSDLKNIDNLYLNDLIANKDKKYNDLTNTILESEIFKEFKLVDSNIKFIDMNGNDISYKQQNSGQFQIKIIANKNDIYWKGETKLITLNLIDEITFLIQKKSKN